MKYILFLMFFVTPPVAPPAPGEKPPEKVWQLQSTSVMEFSTPQACNAVGGSITDSLEKTDTLTVRGWCFCESSGPKQCPKAADVKSFQFDKSQESGSFAIQRLVPPRFK